MGLDVRDSSMGISVWWKDLKKKKKTSCKQIFELNYWRGFIRVSSALIGLLMDNPFVCAALLVLFIIHIDFANKKTSSMRHID